MSKSSALRAYREAQGKTTAQFADELGIPEPTLRSLENGWRPITPVRAKEIEKKTAGGLTRIDLLPELFADLPRAVHRELAQLVAAHVRPRRARAALHG